MDERPYTCSKCGKTYPAAPKWCPCEPYPMADPYEVTFMLEIDPDSSIAEVDSEFPPSVMSMIAGEKNPFKSAVMLKESMGWGMEMLVPGDESKDPVTLEEWIDHFFKTREVRYDPFGGNSKFILLQETFSPGVETLDTLSWGIVDISEEEYTKLLSLAGMCSSSCSTC